MRKYIIALVLVSAGLLLFSCGGGDEKKPAKKSTAAKKKKKIDGAKLYKMNCVICHGTDGKLGINGAKDITESTLTVAEKIELVTNGKGVMTPFGNILNEEKIKAVVEYTNSL